MLPRKRPESRHESQRNAEGNGDIGYRKEVQCSLSEEAGGNSHKRVGGIDIGPKKKEGKSRAQPPSRESPLVQLREVSLPPTRTIESEKDKPGEEGDEDSDYGCRIHQGLASSLRRGRTRS